MSSLPKPLGPRSPEPEMPRPRPATASAAPSRSRLWLVAGAVAIAAAVVYFLHLNAQRRAAADAAARSATRSVPVVATPARRGDMPVTIAGLGTVNALNTVTVRSRVDGQLVRVAFLEGQLVSAGDVLAEIDPRPFAAQLTQAEGARARDAAQLRTARLTLERYRELLKKQFISQQQYDDQAATVGQLAGAVEADDGAIANARLQLTYSKITAPISGRIGLRLVDPGNIVHATDTNGLVVITQIEPSAVVFTISGDEVPVLMKRMAAGQPLTVDAYDRSGDNKISAGRLLTADNLIDPTTGTIKLKAIFENKDHALFPNQFVNVRLLLDVRQNATIIPTAAIQRGPNGTFVYVVKPDQTAEVRPIHVDVMEAGNASVDSGLSGNEIVVVDGADKLRAGSKVEVQKGDAPAPRRGKPTS
jgi:membrane fusion protein, multidrug efflux system